VTEDHDKLMKQLGRLRAIQRQLDHARQQLHQKADEQLASIPEVQEHIEAHAARGKGGGPLAHRALRKLIVERARLHHIVQTRDDDGA
jgi:hypothetical protein